MNRCIVPLAATLCLAACQAYWSSQEFQYYFENVTEQRNETFLAEEGASTIELRLEGGLREGTLSVAVWSPSEVVPWEGTFEAPCEFELAEDLPLELGTWTLRIELHGASGFYVLEMEAED